MNPQHLLYSLKVSLCLACNIDKMGIVTLSEMLQFFSKLQANLFVVEIQV